MRSSSSSRRASARRPRPHERPASPEDARDEAIGGRELARLAEPADRGERLRPPRWRSRRADELLGAWWARSASAYLLQDEELVALVHELPGVAPRLLSFSARRCRRCPPRRRRRRRRREDQASDHHQRAGPGAHGSPLLSEPRSPAPARAASRPLLPGVAAGAVSAAGGAFWAPDTAGTLASAAALAQAAPWPKPAPRPGAAGRRPAPWPQPAPRPAAPWPRRAPRPGALAAACGSGCCAIVAHWARARRRGAARPGAAPAPSRASGLRCRRDPGDSRGPRPRQVLRPMTAPAAEGPGARPRPLPRPAPPTPSVPNGMSVVRGREPSPEQRDSRGGMTSV